MWDKNRQFKATIDEYEVVAKTFGTDQYSYTIYLEGKICKESSHSYYSLKDYSSMIRHDLGLKGKRITWIEI